MRRSFYVLVLLLTLALVSNTFAATLYSEWKGPDGGVWADPANWNATVGIPNATDLGGIMGNPNYKAGFKTGAGSVTSPAVTAGISVTTDIITLGGALGGRLTINGGTLDISEYLTMGANTNESGILQMKDGYLNTGVQYNNVKLFVGQKGVGTIEMTGGTITVGLNYGTYGLLTLADQYDLGITTAQGTIYLDGGIINAGGLAMGGAAVGRSTIIITDGFLLLHGSDLTGAIQSWIDMGAIRGGTGYEAFAAYDPDSNMTIVGAIIPEPATICLLGFGVLGLIGRKK